MNSAAARYNRFQSFYDGLRSLEVNDIVEILEPEFANPISQASEGNPHQEYCMDKCEQSLDRLEKNYCSLMASSSISGSSITAAAANTYYWRVFEQIVDELNNCFSYV